MKRLPTLGKEGLLSESNSVLSIGTARAAKCGMYLNCPGRHTVTVVWSLLTHCTASLLILSGLNILQ